MTLKLFPNFFFIFLNCTLDFGVHVQIMQDCCIGTFMARWFVATIPPSLIFDISPHVISPLPSLPYPSHSTPQGTPVCDAPHFVSKCSHCSTPAYEWEHAVFDFLFLCQFAENDGFQVPPCPYKGHKLTIFYGCIVFHGVYVPHFLNPVCDGWTFGLVPSLCYGEQCHINIHVHVSL